MSLIRNQRSSTNQTLTIKRFKEDEYIGYKSISGTAYYFYVKEWVGLNNYYLVDSLLSSTHHEGFNAESIIVIKCELASDAIGPIFGIINKARIMCEGGNIKWYDDNNSVVHSVAIPSGVHLIGIYSDNGKMKPFMDGKITDTGDAKVMSTRTVIRDFYPCALCTDVFNGAKTGDCLSSTSQTYAIKIYEIAGTFKMGASGSLTSQFMHFYACSNGEDGTTPYMYETRGQISNGSRFLEGNSGSAISGVTVAKGVGPKVTYGVQLHDLQEAWGVFYTQLLAVICCDGGVDRGDGDAAQYYAGWLDYVASNPDVSVNADREESFVLSNRTFKSAFYLDTPHLPTGYSSLQKPVDYANLEDGQLIRGRKPMWSIWNDIINFGKYIKKVTVQESSQTYYKYLYVFNIFKDVYGRDIFNLDNPDLLGVFDGYNTTMANNRPPQIIPPSSPATMYFYVTENFDPSAEGSAVYSNHTYPYNKQGTGTMVAKLGNLPWWNLSFEELFAPSGYNGLSVFGAVVVLQVIDNSEWHEIAKFVALTEETHEVSGQTVALPLCKESTTDKTKFRDDGVDLGFSYGGFSDLARLSDEPTFKSKAVLYMAQLHSLDVNVKTSCVDCSNVCPATEIEAAIVRRFTMCNLIGDLGQQVVIGSTAYNVFMGYNDGSNPDTYQVTINNAQSLPVYYPAMGIKFMLVPASVTSPTASDAIDLFTQVNNEWKPKVYVYMEVTRAWSWAHIAGCYTTEIITTEGSVSNFPSTGNSDYYYVRTKTGQFYHWTGSAYVEDTIVDIPVDGNLPGVSSSNYHKTYHKYISADDYEVYRLSKVLVDEGKTGVNAYVKLPTDYVKGVLYNKYNGWAVPFAYPDLSSSSIFNQNGDPFADPNTAYFTRLGKRFSNPGRTSRKIALSTLYYNFLQEYTINGNTGNIKKPEGWKRNTTIYDDEPAYARYRIYDANNLPVSWGVKKSSAGFSNTGEGWVLGAASNYKYLIIDKDNILPSNEQVVVRAHMRLYDPTEHFEKYLASDYKRFKVTMYRQAPCRPYVYNGQYNDTQYNDSDYCTKIFENIAIASANTDTSEITGADGVKYKMRVYASTNDTTGAVKYIGSSSDLDRKYCTVNPYCYVLEIRITSNGVYPVGGSNYLIQFTSY